jgi:hypothetical protein
MATTCAPRIISNLAWMMAHPGLGDSHNAPVFVWCYKRMGDFIPQLLGEDRQPRVMLDYSGTLLHGMRQMGLDDVFDALGYLTHDSRARLAAPVLAVRPPGGTTQGPSGTTAADAQAAINSLPADH